MLNAIAIVTIIIGLMCAALSYHRLLKKEQEFKDMMQALIDNKEPKPDIKVDENIAEQWDRIINYNPLKGKGGND